MPEHGESRNVGSGFSDKHRSVILTVGDRCRVEPLNPQKMKNRGRTCTITGFRRFGMSEEMASVIWDDTRSHGGADLGDLALIPPK